MADRTIEHDPNERCDQDGCDREARYRLRRSYVGGADLHYACAEHCDDIEARLLDESITRHVTVSAAGAT